MVSHWLFQGKGLIALTIGYQQAYGPAVLPIPTLGPPRVPGLPSPPPLSQVARAAVDRPMLLGAAVSGGLGAILLGWALVLAGTDTAGAEPADFAPPPAVAPAEVPPPTAPAPDSVPVAPPSAPVAPIPTPAPEVITFDTGGAACFPFQPC
ncbi:hypothetical protein [Nocardia paucivorans]|uniref:hypothetical protein n=1 Tax=Nocardia paucivorans TaxID=114259 RepID=UPI0003072B9C|nr:hypothetical protein [Nocardia paucivorans]